MNAIAKDFNPSASEAEWEAEREALFAEQERDLKEMESNGWHWVTPALSDEEHIQRLYEDQQERQGVIE